MDWVQIWEFLTGPAKSSGPRLLRRSFRISADVRRSLADCDGPTREEFGELLLKLDADPIGHSFAVLQPDATKRGVRWAPLVGSKRVIFALDPSQDRLHVLTLG